VAPNPEAIAWYLKRSEDLLGELRERVQSLRLRGGQLAGFSGAILAVAGADAGPALDSLSGMSRELAGASLLVGAILLVASLTIALRGTLLPRLVSDISAREVANYASTEFLEEPELWRVHVRTIRGLLVSIEVTTEQGDKATRAVRWAGHLFLGGLFAVGNALGILVVVVVL
jgi:hypothetical protein